LRGSVFAVAVSISSFGLRAESSLYMGASVFRSEWNVGLVDRQAENTISSAPISSSIVNAGLGLVFNQTNSGMKYTTLFVNQPANASLNNLGLFGSYNFSDLWALSFNVTMGSTNFQSSRTMIYGNSNPQSSCGSGCTNLASTFESPTYVGHRVDVDRKDLDIAFSRRLAETPFSLFGGLKLQDWNYQTDLSFGPGVVNSSTQPLSGSLATGSGGGLAGFQYSYKSQAYGPAFGAGYTFTIDNVQALSAQVGLVYLFGNIQIQEKNFGRQNAVDQTNGSTTITRAGGSYYLNDRTTDRLEMPGFTLKLDYRRVVGPVILRAGVFYQEVTVKSTDPKNEGTTALLSDISSPIALPATPKNFQPQFSVGGAKDIFKGISFSVSTKIW